MIETGKRHTPNETSAKVNHTKESKQAEPSLTVYTSDDGDFAEASRARIAE
jgi:hypothetical protein